MKQVMNRTTGKVGELDFDSKEGVFIVVYYNFDTKEYTKHLYSSIKELNEEWEDYEEDEYYWAITSIKYDGGITKMKNKHNDMTSFDKSIGNYFETKEEAEKAVEKLKAWKRLKDKGFRFVKYDTEHCGISTIYFIYDNEIDKKDLDLLFSGD